MDQCLDNAYLQQSPPSLFDLNSSMGKKTDYPYTWSVMTDPSIQDESMSSPPVYSPYQESLPDQEQTELADIQTSTIAQSNPQRPHDVSFPSNVTEQQESEESDVSMFGVTNETSAPNGQAFQASSMPIALSDPHAVRREEPATEKEKIASLVNYLKTAEDEVQGTLQATQHENPVFRECSQPSMEKYRPSAVRAAEVNPVQEMNGPTTHAGPGFPNVSAADTLLDRVLGTIPEQLPQGFHSMPNLPVASSDIVAHSGPDEQPGTSYDLLAFTEGCGQQPLQQTNTDIAVQLPSNGTAAVHSLDSNWKHIPHQPDAVPFENPVNTAGAFIKVEPPEVQPFTVRQGVKQRRKRKGGLGEDELQKEIENKRQKDWKKKQAEVPGQTEKKERRKQQNRDAAMRCREKKKREREAWLKQQEELEEANQKQEEENKRMRQQIAVMEAFLKQHVPACGTESADTVAKWSTLMTGAARMKD